MDISNYSSDAEFRTLIEERIESNPTPKYLTKYPKWASKFNGGFSISYIAAYWDVDYRIVKQGLYAMDVIDRPPIDIDESLEENLILDYYMNPSSTHESLRTKYGMLNDERVSRIARLPALRVHIERHMGEEEIGEIEDSDFTDEQIDEIEERLRENPTKYHAEGTDEEDWELPEEDQFKSASDVLMF